LIVLEKDKLRLVSYLAPNSFWLYEAVATQLGQALSVETQLWQSEVDPLDDPLLQQNQWDLAFICGLPFVRHNRMTVYPLRAFAAPVMQAERYQNHPIYFADVIVRSNSNFITFADLAGKTLCYNDLGSNSGYNLLRHRLKQESYPPTFFGQTIASGSHQRSIQWVIKGLADCAAIDSTVLEQTLRDSSELATQIKIIESIGPCPMPPIVAAKRLGEATIQRMQAALLQPDAPLQQAMAQAQIQRYTAVTSDDYDPIAILYDEALAAGYERLG
jgi:phosphonate transport system substrate-binding protein